MPRSATTSSSRCSRPSALICTASTWTVPRWRTFNSARMLHVQCVHDTMNATVGPDGAVDHDKPEADWLPRIVSLGNRGDERGEPRPPAAGGRSRSSTCRSSTRSSSAACSRLSRSRSRCPTRSSTTPSRSTRPTSGRSSASGSADCCAPSSRRASCGTAARRRSSPSAPAPTRRSSSARPSWDRPTSTTCAEPGTDWPETDHEHHVDLTAKAQDGIRHPPALGLRRAAHEGLRAAALPLSDASPRSFGALPAVDDREPPCHSLACRDDRTPHGTTLPSRPRRPRATRGPTASPRRSRRGSAPSSTSAAATRCSGIATSPPAPST